MIRTLGALAACIAISAVAVSAGNFKRLDAMPALTPMADSAWVILYRDKARSSNEIDLTVYYEQRLLVDVKDNSMSFVKVPVGTGKLFAGADNHTTEFTCLTVKPGKIYYVQLEIREIRNSEQIMLSLLMPDEAIEQLKEDDDVDKVKFMTSPDELIMLRDRKWDRALEDYEEWLEDSEEDYENALKYTGFDAMFPFDFGKKR